MKPKKHSDCTKLKNKKYEAKGTLRLHTHKIMLQPNKLEKPNKHLEIQKKHVGLVVLGGKRMGNKCCFRMGVFYFWQPNSCSMICRHIVPDTDFNKNNCAFHFAFLLKNNQKTTYELLILFNILLNLNVTFFVNKSKKFSCGYYNMWSNEFAWSVCWKVGENDRFGVDEVVGPIRQTLQSQVTWGVTNCGHQW